MIFGDTLLITKNGIEVNRKVLETIGVFEQSKVHILPLRTFEHRTSEPSYKFPLDLIITPIHPKVWPFVLRFEIRIYNNAKSLERAYEFFYKIGLNILFSESTRSGHHHIVLNVLGTMKRIEGKTINEIFEDIKKMNSDIKNALWYNAIQEFMNTNKNENGNGNENFYEIYKNNKDNKDKNNLSKILGKFYKKHFTSKTTNRADNSIQNILYKEILRLRPVIRKYRIDFKDDPSKLNEAVETEIIPLKQLLNFVLYYKQKLIEKLEILMLQDALIKPDIKINEFDFTNAKSIARDKKDIYIGHL